MRIIVAHNAKEYNGLPVETYARSIIRVLCQWGHDVTEVPKEPPFSFDVYAANELLLDLDCGRNDKGELRWHGEEQKPPIKSAVYFIDSHGYPDLHRKLARNYDHCFFAVWSRRDLFDYHKSAHWLPNFTDKMWFERDKYPLIFPSVDFGFFGSKGGLDRADPLVNIAKERCYTYDVRQINKGHKHRWPATAEAMANCHYLFNHGQKHDGPNLRVLESMAMGRPLINNFDNTEGMPLLFEPWKHFIPYGHFNEGKGYSYDGLASAMEYCMSGWGLKIATEAYYEVMARHLVENRLKSILEVVNA